MPTEKLIIFPYNGNALEAIDCIEGQYELIGFADDTVEKQRTGALNGLPVYDRAVFNKYKDVKVLAVPGGPKSYLQRKEILAGLTIDAKRFARVIHPSAKISSLASVGYNVLIMAGVVVTSNASIGNHVLILPNSVLHHDVVIHDFNLIGSNVAIAGSTHIEENCYIGSGSNLMNNITIGTQSLIGLGSNIIKSVEKGKVMIGNPGKPTN